MIEQMRAHVAERADAEVGPAAPVEWVIDRMIGDRFRHRPDVQIPVQSWRRWVGSKRGCQQLIHVTEAEWISEWAWWRSGRRRARGSRNSLRPIHDRTIGPDMNFPHRANNAGLNP